MSWVLQLHVYLCCSNNLLIYLLIKKPLSCAALGRGRDTSGITSGSVNLGFTAILFVLQCIFPQSQIFLFLVHFKQTYSLLGKAFGNLVCYDWWLIYANFVILISSQCYQFWGKHRQAVSDITFIYAVYTHSLITSSVVIQAILPSEDCSDSPTDRRKRGFLDWTLCEHVFVLITFPILKSRAEYLPRGRRETQTDPPAKHIPDYRVHMGFCTFPRRSPALDQAVQDLYLGALLLILGPPWLSLSCCLKACFLGNVNKATSNFKPHYVL